LLLREGGEAGLGGVNHQDVVHGVVLLDPESIEPRRHRQPTIDFFAIGFVPDRPTLERW
jgi:hypothetical protein